MGATPPQGRGAQRARDGAEKISRRPKGRRLAIPGPPRDRFRPEFLFQLGHLGELDGSERLAYTKDGRIEPSQHAGLVRIYPESRARVKAL